MSQSSQKQYSKGAMIVYEGVRRMILEELGDLRFTSHNESPRANWRETVAGDPYHILELERGGWTVEEKIVEDEWPKNGEKYWFIADMEIAGSTWENDFIDNQRRKQLGIYRTYEEATTALRKCRKALGME